MKVEIRKTKLSDAEQLRALINDKQVIKQLEGYPHPCPLSKIKKEIKKSQLDWKKKTAYNFTIFADAKIAGQVVLENPDKNKTHYEIGYFVGRKFWNKGIATKAVKEAVRFGFNKLKLKRIWGDNDSDNPASGKIMKKAGFKLEGRLRKHVLKNRKFIDVWIWGKVR
ncbi:GNAT family N-acetyltransferase [Candidatus Woesearchaeota archaeon]|nr:GNAT family N-acetyltransferase [Candidatus Woesearchaeota archaeon]